MPNSHGNNGAPISLGGVNVIRLADADAVALAAGSTVSGVPTVARAYTLPGLATVGPGDTITVQNLGVAVITVTAAGTDAINDAGAPGTFDIAPGGLAVFEAKVVDGVTAGTWFAEAPAATGTYIGLQRFNSNGTYTPTPGATHIDVEVTGGGGGGGGAAADANPTAGSGGGAGGTSYNRFTLVAAAPTAAVTIGAGGAGGVGALDGASGAGSTFIYNGVTVSGNGGSAGQTIATAAGAVFISASVLGGTGSTGGGAGYTARGGRGQSAIYLSAVVVTGGDGGSSVRSGVGAGTIRTSAGGLNGGSASSNTGSGGGGAAQNNNAARNGGNGADGMIIVREYR